MNTESHSELVKRYQSMSTADLVKAVTLDRKDYQLEAIELIEKELAQRNVSLDEAREAQKKIEQDEILKDRQLFGLRGWLLCFVIVLAANSLFYIVWGVDLISQAHHALSYFLSVVSLLIGCYGFFSSGLLFNKKQTAPNHARRWLIIGLVYNLLLALVSFAITKNTGQLVLMSGSAAIFSTLWLSYLKSSRRVALTYQKCKEF